MHDLLVRANGPDRASWVDLPDDPGIYVVSCPIGEVVECLETPGGATFATRADPAHLRRKRNGVQKTLLIQASPAGRQLGFENWLLEAFFGEHGDYPFANRKGPLGADRWAP